MRRLAPALCLIIAGCGLFDVFGGSTLNTLRQNRERWRDLYIVDYDFDFRNTCFCVPESTQPVRIEVRAGAVSQVLSVPSGAVVAPSQFIVWPTIDSLFVWTERRLGYRYKLDITYDGAFHFPARVSGDIPNAVDDEFVHTATNLVRK